MAKGELKIDVRRQKILDLLQRDGQVRVTQLAELFRATQVTIRSDLDALERDGYLERIQGGAVQTVRNFYNLDFVRRKQERLDEKKGIALAAARLVHDGDTLLMNSGTTTYLMAIELKQHKNLNIVTNSISIAMELGAYPTFRIILLGGDINAQYLYTFGENAKEQLSLYKADYAILSIDGVCPKVGLTTYHAQESVIDSTMMERARETIVVADSSKIGHESFSFVADMSSLTTCVTDQKADSSVLQKIRDLGVQVITT